MAVRQSTPRAALQVTLRSSRLRPGVATYGTDRVRLELLEAMLSAVDQPPS